MKLINKKTGEIGYTAILRSKAIVVMDENAIQLGSYDSLAELNEEWEDAPKEPRKYWHIYAGQVLKNECDGVMEDRFKEIGNYFETREEAEKAVEKLKAWKRLKDNGIIFILDEGNVLPSISIHSKEDNGPALKSMQIVEDLTLLFGGEDEQ